MQFTNVVVQLASVPLFLTFWSKERYGAWLLISAIPAYLSLGEAGFATFAANEVSIAIAQNDRPKALRSLHTAWGFLVGISVVLLALMLLAFFTIPWDAWLKTSAVSGDETRWTILLLSLYSITGILVQVFCAIYRAAYRNARGSYLPSGARLIELAAMGIGVAVTSSMVTVAGLMLAVRLILFLVQYVDSRAFSPDLNLGFTGFSLAELKCAWRPSVMFMALTMGNVLYNQGLTLLVGASLGAVAVVVFNTTRTITRVIVQFVSMIKLSVQPEFSFLFGTGDMVRARRLNELAFEASWGASVGLGVVIFIAAPWIMPLWTHHAVQIDPLLLAIFLASAFLNGIWSVTTGLLMGTNQHEGFTIRYVIAASFALVFGAVSVHSLGMYGIAFATVVCELFMLPYAISRSCQLLHQPVKGFIIGSLQLRAVRQTTITYYHRWLAEAR